MTHQPSQWSAELKSGPFDGATVGLDLSSTDLPRAVIVTFVVGEKPAELAGHSYVLDRVHQAFRYLGEDGDLEAGSPDGTDLDAPVEGLALVGAPDDALARRFYELLFESHAEVRDLFAADIRPQAARLSTALQALLEHLGDADWLITELGELGAQHARWGVTEPMYVAFNDCMLAALAEQSGDAWTPAAETAWTETFDEVRGLMLDGAARAAEDGPGA